MDLGVGSFVFSQGLVSALPMIKNPRYLTEPFIPKFAQTLRKCLPVLILGLFRTVSVKGTEYPVCPSPSSSNADEVTEFCRSTKQNMEHTGTSLSL